MAVLPIFGPEIALNALGFETSEDQGMERETWDTFAEVAREAYETLADTLTPNADHPREASRLANAALQSALANQTSGGLGRPYRGGRRRSGRNLRSRGPRRARRCACRALAPTRRRPP